MLEDLPFEITPQIKRYLEELTLSDEFDFSGNEKSIVKTFDIGERLSDDSFANIENFIKYLKSSELVKVDEFPKIIKTGKIKKIHPDTLKMTVLDQESLQDLANLINQKHDTKIRSSHVQWHKITRTLSYRDIKPYTFHDKKNSARLEIFKILWKRKRHEVAGQIKTIGKPLNPRFIASEIGFTQNTRMDSYNKKGVEKVSDQARYLGRAIKRFPLRITTGGGILMTLKE